MGAAIMIATRCCSCGDEIAHGLDAWKGAHEDETCCSILCRYRSLVEEANSWTMSMPFDYQARLVRVLAFKKAVLYDPEIFGESEFSVTVKARMHDGRESVTAGMIVLGASMESVSFEIVRSSAEDGEFDGDTVVVGWEDLLDVVMMP